MEKTNEQIIAEAEFYTGAVGNLDGAVRVLAEAKELGKNINIQFNGHILNSLLDNEESCFIWVLWKTKAEYEEQEKKLREESEIRKKKELEEAEAKIPSWVERGEKIIYPQRHSEWKKCVETTARRIYNGEEIECSLKIMEMLEKGESLKAVEKIFNGLNHTGHSYGIMASIILTFSKRGPEFIRHINNGNLSQEEKALVAKIEAENAEYAKALGSQPGGGNE